MINDIGDGMGIVFDITFAISIINPSVVPTISIIRIIIPILIITSNIIITSAHAKAIVYNVSSS